MIQEIYDKLNIETVLSELNPKNKGDYYTLDCPFCLKKEAYLYTNGNKSFVIECNRKNNCGHEITIWDYIANRDNITNKRDVIKRLAQLADYKLPQSFNYQPTQEEKETIEKDSLLSEFLTFFKSKIWEEEGNKVKRYLLEKRKYSEQDIKNMEIGVLPDINTIEKHFQSINGQNTKEVLKKLGFNNPDYGSKYKLSIPIKNETGLLKGFCLRTIDNYEPKYKYTFGTDKTIPFNLHQVRNEHTLVLVEGLFDCLIPYHRGVKNIISIGGNRLTKEQLKSIIKYTKAKHLILCLDNDNAGKEGTLSSINLTNETKLRCYVANIPDPYKDSDELIKNKDIDTFKNIIANPISSSKWIANYILSKYDLQNDLQKELCLEESLLYEEKLLNPIDSKDFLDIITKGLNYNYDTIKPLIHEYREKKKRELIKKQALDYIKKANELLKKNELYAFQNLLNDTIKEIKGKSDTNIIIQPYRLDKLKTELKESKQGLLTGYESLDRYFSIPCNTLSIIAGRPSHGKTTMLLNLFINMIERYKERAFFFFSYEETKKQLAPKIISILSDTIIAFDKYNQNLNQLINYIKGDNNGFKDINKAMSKFDQYVTEGRLWIIDEPLFIDDLGYHLSNLKEKFNVGAVFIDYIQKVKIRNNFGTRQLELQKISEILLETAKELSIPIILGAQLGRDKNQKDKVNLDNLRESGDIEQDANLVLGLYNYSKEKDSKKGRYTNLSISILKNRDGISGKEIDLIFDQPAWKIKEATTELITTAIASLYNNDDKQYINSDSVENAINEFKTLIKGNC